MDGKEEIKLVQDAWIKLWHTYITWFTWHFAIHMTIIAGLLSIAALKGLSRTPLYFILGFAFLGLGATVAMIKYEKETKERVKTLDPALPWTAFGGPLSAYAGWATMTTTLLLIVVWIYLIANWPIA